MRISRRSLEVILSLPISSRVESGRIWRIDADARDHSRCDDGARSICGAEAGRWTTAYLGAFGRGQIRRAMLMSDQKARTIAAEPMAAAAIIER